MNEKALIKRCRHGDREAFDELIRLYYDYVSGFLFESHGKRNALRGSDTGNLFKDDTQH